MDNDANFVQDVLADLWSLVLSYLFEVNHSFVLNCPNSKPLKLVVVSEHKWERYPACNILKIFNFINNNG